jgi:hypothetical protein
VAKIKKEFIEDNAIDASKINIGQNTYLKGRNFANDADVNIVKVNASDEIEFASLPKVGASNVLIASDKGANNGVASLDGNGLIPIGQIPPAALERLVAVADEAARFALTTATVQLGDTVKQNDTGVLYLVVDEDELDNATGYQIYNAGSTVNFTGSLAGEVTGTQGTTVVENSAVIAKVLTGLSLASSAAIEATDSILVASGKLQAQINNFVGADAEEQTFTLNGTDITNQYIDLAFEAMVGSVQVFPKGGPKQTLTDDYTLNYTGGAGSATRISFAGDLASTLVAGHKLMVNYLKA